MPDSDALTSELELRVELVSSLQLVAAGRAAPRLASLAARFRELDRSEEGQESVYGLILDAVVNAVRWREAVHAAESDASRFRDAAHLKARQAMDILRRPYPPQLHAVIEAVCGLADPLDDTARAADLLASLPLPLRVLGPPDYRRPFRVTRPQESPGATTVDVQLSLDGRRVSDVDTLQRGHLVRLDAVVRLSEWPAGARQIRLELISDVQVSAVERGEIVIASGSRRGSTTIVPFVIISPLAPAEFALSAQFIGDDPLPAVHLVGDRELRLATSDGVDELPAGFPAATARIAEMLRELDAKRLPITHDDRVHLLRLLGGAVSFWGAAMDRHVLRIPRPVSEDQFQAALAGHLQSNPRIGNELAEARRLGGGESDLLLGRVVDELKVENGVAVTLNSALRYHDQAAAYAAPIDCPVSVLTILDASPKAHPPGLIGNDVGWVYPTTHGDASFAPSMVAVAIIPIDFPIPSSLSRRGRGSRRRRPASDSGGGHVDGGPEA